MLPLCDLAKAKKIILFCIIVSLKIGTKAKRITNTDKPKETTGSMVVFISRRQMFPANRHTVDVCLLGRHNNSMYVHVMWPAYSITINSPKIKESTGSLIKGYYNGFLLVWTLIGP